MKHKYRPKRLKNVPGYPKNKTLVVGIKTLLETLVIIIETLAKIE